MSAEDLEEDGIESWWDAAKITCVAEEYIMTTQDASMDDAKVLLSNWPMRSNCFGIDEWRPSFHFTPTPATKIKSWRYSCLYTNLVVPRWRTCECWLESETLSNEFRFLFCYSHPTCCLSLSINTTLLQCCLHFRFDPKYILISIFPTITFSDSTMMNRRIDLPPGGRGRRRLPGQMLGQPGRMQGQMPGQPVQTPT